MPNRYIRESLLTSPNFNRLSAEGERHFYRILLLADDFGCFESTPEVIKGKCYPLKFEVTVEDIKQWQVELEKHDMIFTWDTNGRQYSVFCTFPKQNYIRSIHKRKTPPPPPDIERKLLNTADEWLRVYQKQAPQTKQTIEEPLPEPYQTNGERKLDANLARMVEIYENNCGLLTATSLERLRALSDEYSVEQFQEAVIIAKGKGVYKLSYIEGILRNGENRRDNKAGGQKGIGKDRKAAIGKPLR